MNQCKHMFDCPINYAHVFPLFARTFPFARYSIGLLIMSTHEFDSHIICTLRNTDVSSNNFGAQEHQMSAQRKLIEIVPHKHTNVSCVHTPWFCLCFANTLWCVHAILCPVRVVVLVHRQGYCEQNAGCRADSRCSFIRRFAANYSVCFAIFGNHFCSSGVHRKRGWAWKNAQIEATSSKEGGKRANSECQRVEKWILLVHGS